MKTYLKIALLSALLLSLSNVIFSQNPYSRVRVYGNEDQMKTAIQMGIPLDHGIRKKGMWVETDLSEQEILKLTNHGFQVENLIEDVQNFYIENNNQATRSAPPIDFCSGQGSTFVDPTNFSLGSMGGAYTYAEFIGHLDNMSNLFPNLITARAAIDTFMSHNGYPIYYVKISDNPTTDEPEPELLYTAIHHAREPGSLTQLVYYMYHLLENYGTDPEVTYLVDNTEMYFVPMINPDGYIYNEQTNPNGGGMWRKNRKDNGGGEWGVDLNRNYDHFFALDDNGSSPDPASDTYRGTSGFSEPETQAVKWLCENHEFQITLNYHTYGDLFIYPWGYDVAIFTPDSATFFSFAQVMTAENGYSYGTGGQLLGYVTNGDSDDWMYGEQTSKPKIFSMTPEVGTGGFWPNQNQMLDDSRNCLRQNLLLPHLLLKYAEVKDLSNSNVSDTSFYIPVEINSFGLQEPADFVVSLNSLSSDVTYTDPAISFTSMTHLESRTDSFLIQLNGNITQGTMLKFDLVLSNGTLTFHDTISKTYGVPTVLFSDDATSGLAWFGDWQTTVEDYVSASYSWTDSPNSSYNNSSSYYMELSNPIDLSTYASAGISFYAKWDIEAGWDYVQLEASSDGGTNWTPLCGKYTKPGNNNQDEGMPLYDGVSDWVFEEMDLSDFAGQYITLRFKLISDQGVTADGMYVDDFSVHVLEENQDTSGTQSLFESTELLEFSLSPNPGNEYVFVSFRNLNSPAELVIRDMKGQTILTKKVSSGNKSIKLKTNSFPPGIYFITLSSENGNLIQKKLVLY